MKVNGYGVNNNRKPSGVNSSSRKPSGKGRKAANKNSKQLKIMLIALGVLVVGLVAIGVVIYGQLTNDDYTSLFVQTSAPAAEDIDPAVSGVQTQAPAESRITYNGKTYEKNKNIVNIVFLGIDSTTERDIGNHSDMIIVCAVDTVTRKATLISIPRDTWTDISKVDTKTGKISEMTQNRINTAYLFGGGPNKYGASNAKACVQKFLEREIELKTKLNFTLDIPVPFFVSIDMDGITNITNAVGGVEVKLDSTIPDVGKKGQTVNLKGLKAETYLRDRHNTNGADIGRAAHQRDFMIQLAKKIKGMNAVEAVTKLWDEFNTYGKTDLNLDQALAFAKILNNVDIDAIEQLAVPGEVGNVGDASVILHDEAGTLDLLLGVYYNEIQ